MGLFSRGESRSERRDREFSEWAATDLQSRFDRVYGEMDERDAQREAAADPS